MTDENKKTPETPKAGSSEAFQVSSNGTVTPPKDEPKKTPAPTASPKATSKPDAAAQKKAAPKPDTAKPSSTKPAGSSTGKASPSTSSGAAKPTSGKSFSIKPYLYGVAVIAIAVAGLTLYPIVERGAGTPPLPSPLSEAASGLNEWVFGPVPSMAAPQVEDRFAPLEARIKALEGVNPADQLQSMDERIATLENRLDTLNEQAPTTLAGTPVVDAPSNLSDIEIRLTQLTDRLGKLEQTPEDGADQATVAEVPLTPGEDATGTLADTQAQLDDLLGRVEQAETALAQMKSDISEGLNAASSTGQGALSDLEARLDERLASLNERIEQGGTGTAALALGLSNLQRAVDAGYGYEPELKAVRGQLAAVGSDDALAFLDRYVKTGLPTVSDLQTGFPEAVRKMLEAARGGESPDWTDRVMARLSNIVTIRKTGELTGTDMESILARMELRLRERDVAAAQAEAEGLPEAAKTAGAEWLSELALRARADATIRTLFAEMVLRIDG